MMDAMIINNRYHVTDKSLDGEILHYGEYISVNPWIEDGLTRNYSAPGQLYSTGNYSHGKLIGEWLYYNQDQTIDTVNYDLCIINTATDDCYTRRKPTFNRKDSQEIQIITDSVSLLINKNFHLPARTRNNTRAFNAYIKFMMEDNGEINCLSITGVEDDDLMAEIHRIICLFNYEKVAKKDLLIELEMKYNENENLAGSPSTLPAETEDSEMVFTLVEHDPEFKNDNYKSFSDFIEKTLIYPPLALKYSIQGVVIVQFIVETDGSVSNVRVVKGIDPVLDNEAIRVIEQSPEWEPGRQQGEPVRVRINVPLPFPLDLIEKEIERRVR